MDQLKKARAFRELHKGPGVFVIPNPWDAGSAHLLQVLGFEALATTSAGLAFSLARPDGENAVSRDEVLRNARQIVSATSLPVSADLEGGFGAAPEDCAETIQLAADFGLVGGSIEDSTGDVLHPIYDIEQAVDRIRAASEAAQSLAFPFMLTARAENFLHGRPDLADTIERLQRFQDAGADVLFAPGLRSAEDIRSVITSVDKPVNVIMGLQGVTLTVEELAGLGVKRISLGSSLARAALRAFLDAAYEVAGEGSFTFANKTIPFAEINGMFARKG